MKHEIFERPEIRYIGFKTEVNLKNIEESNIGGIWDELFKNTPSLNIALDAEYIGLEKYSSNTMETGLFNYYALVSVANYDGVSGKFEQVALPEGKYIKFPVLFKELGPDKYQEVYKYVKDNNISVDIRFDFELYPQDFDPSNDNAIMFITLKIEE